MVDAKRILRARTVEDVSIESAASAEPEQDIGTRVGDQVLSTDRDTLFPLQAALGYDITQSLFIGEHSLLVEGPAEILYFPWFSRKLQAADKVGLDKRWTLTPCAGVDKIPAFLSLFAGQKLHIATMLDYATGQKGKVEQMRKSELLRSSHVLTADQYAGQPEADIEDIIGREAYIALVNACYKLEGKFAIPVAKPAGAPARVVNEVEEHFRTVATTGDEFDHYRPAEFLTQQGVSYSLPGLDKALERFGKLFTDLNALL
jgi:hypothetical protein